MESEIKQAWKMGYTQAMIDFSRIEVERREIFAEERWIECLECTGPLQSDLWNDLRIKHRDE